MDYEKLKESYSKKNCDYTLVKRNDKAAIYSMKYKNTDLIVGYDVFMVKIQPEIKWPNGTVSPSKEAFPCSESWGVWAFSYDKLETAENKYDEITNNKILISSKNNENLIDTEKTFACVSSLPSLSVKRGRGRPRKNLI